MYFCNHTNNRKTMKLLKIFIIVIAAFSFAGSAYAENSADSTKSKKKTRVIKRVFKSYNNCKKDAGSCTYFDLSYQVVKSGNARSTINETIQDSLLKAVNIWDNKKPADFKIFCVALFFAGAGTSATTRLAFFRMALLKRSSRCAPLPTPPGSK